MGGEWREDEEAKGEDFEIWKSTFLQRTMTNEKKDASSLGPESGGKSRELGRTRADTTQHTSTSSILLEEPSTVQVSTWAQTHSALWLIQAYHNAPPYYNNWTKSECVM